MAKVYLYDWKTRQNVAESSYVEPIALACLAGKGKYEILIKDIDELIEVEDDCVLNTYIPEPEQTGPIRVSSAYGWNYQLWVSNRLIWSGSFSVSVFEDAFSASKHGRVEMILWPIEADGLPIGTNE